MTSKQIGNLQKLNARCNRLMIVNALLTLAILAQWKFMLLPEVHRFMELLRAVY